MLHRRQYVLSSAQRFLVKRIHVSNQGIAHRSRIHVWSSSSVCCPPWQTDFIYASSCRHLIIHLSTFGAIVKFVHTPFLSPEKVGSVRNQACVGEESTTEEDAVSTAQSRQRSHILAFSGASSWCRQCCQSGPSLPILPQSQYQQMKRLFFFQ